jgi:tetratricopeptide (TPR) repeat protein
MHRACIALNIYCYQGKINTAYQNSNKALALAEESGDILSKAEAFVNHGATCCYKGFIDEAEEHLLRGKDFSERSNSLGHIMTANFQLVKVYRFKGEFRKEQEYYHNALSYEKFGVLGPSWFNLLRLIIAAAQALNNEKGIDLNSLYSYVSQNKIRRAEGSYKRYLSEILLNIDDDHLPEAEDWIKKALESDERNGMKWNLARDYGTYAEIYQRKGDIAMARENLSKAIEMLKECGADGWVERFAKELAILQ